MIRPEPDIFGEDGIIQIPQRNRTSASIHSKVVYESVCKKLECVAKSDEVWIVFGPDQSSQTILASFSAEIVANMLVFYLKDAPKPVKRLRSEVAGPVDEFKEALIRANKPYYVFLENGLLVEAYGPEATDKVLSVMAVELDLQLKTIKGTFWEMRRNLAIEKAQMLWLEHAKG